MSCSLWKWRVSFFLYDHTGHPNIILIIKPYIIQKYWALYWSLLNITSFIVFISRSTLNHTPLKYRHPITELDPLTLDVCTWWWASPHYDAKQDQVLLDGSRCMPAIFLPAQCNRDGPHVLCLPQAAFELHALLSYLRSPFQKQRIIGCRIFMNTMPIAATTGLPSCHTLINRWVSCNGQILKSYCHPKKIVMN